MNVIVTCSGKSKRFLKKGIKQPKFLLDFYGKSILENIVDMFGVNDKFYFIFSNSQKEHFSIPILKCLDRIKQEKKNILD